MNTRTRFLPAIALVLAACGGEPAPTAPPQATDTPSAAPAPPPPAPTAEPAAAPTASASASAGPSKPPPRASSGRPAVMKSDASEISDTFGSPPAKLELGDKDIATLRLPEGALRQATNLTFKLDGRGKSNGAPAGKIYRLSLNYPPSGTLIEAESVGDPFILELPAGAKKDANLAIGVEDEKGKVTWHVVAPKRIDDVRNVAVFELTKLPSAWIHVTTKKPTEEKK
jgi:hypothetical protein